jgi:hypothetical protein
MSRPTTRGGSRSTLFSRATGEPELSYAEFLDELLPAARAAGLVHRLQIVAFTASGHNDQFLYYATRVDVETAHQERPAGADGPSRIDLLVFMTSGT